MTLDEARDHIGEHVICSVVPGPPEEGVIVTVNRHYVFVQYGENPVRQATYPDCLTLTGSEDGT